MPAELQRLGVIGAGAVGTLLADALLRAGREVLLIESATARAAQIAKDGLLLQGAPGAARRPTALLGSVEELGGRPLDALFICTKTWSLAGLLPLLAKALQPSVLVISYQNGISPEDELAQAIPPERLARGVINFAGTLEPQTGVTTQHWFNPPCYLGPLTPQGLDELGALAALLSQAGLTTQAVAPATIKRQAFFKAVLSSALNALCALSGITMRQAMSYHHTRALARLLLREGLTVGAALGYHYGEDALERCLRYLEQGGDHRPSMWTDLQRGTPTEIEQINGKIVELGIEGRAGFRGLSVEYNAFFTMMVITQEIELGVRSAEEIPAYLARV